MDEVLEKPQLERNQDIALKTVQFLINAIELAQRRGAYSAKPTENPV